MRTWLRILPLLFVAALAACAGTRGAPPEGAGALGPSTAVERFLRLAGEDEYLRMGWVFGTQQGPVMRQWPRAEVEQRMYALASVLEHDAFVVGSSTPVPGRLGSAMSFTVRLTRGRNTYDVPVVAVRGPGDRWFVEQVAVEAVTSPR